MSLRNEGNYDCVVLDSSDSDMENNHLMTNGDINVYGMKNDVHHNSNPICVSDDEGIIFPINNSKNQLHPTISQSSSEESLPSIKLTSDEHNVKPFILQHNQNIRNSNEYKYSSSSSSDLELQPLNERMKPKLITSKDYAEPYLEKSKRIISHSISDSEDDSYKILDRKRAAQQAKEKEKQEHLKKQEHQKKLKEDERNERKIIVPGECMKTITVLVDNAMLEMKGSSELLTAFQSRNLNYALEPQPLKNCVTWKRTFVEEQQKKDVLEDQVLLLLEPTEFVNLVEAETEQSFEELYPSSESLWGLVKKVKSLFLKMHVTFLIYGMEQYFRKNKSKEKSNFKLNVDNEVASKKRRTNKTVLPVVTRIKVEEAITKIQIIEKINFRCVEAFTEVVEVITTYTKAIGERYFKKHRNRNDEFVSCLSDSMATVKVDKDGTGLIKVWEEQIMTFNQVSSDVAQSIIVKYPSPVALLKAYELCKDQKSAEHLLENIEVRRGSGVLTSARRIGPELSYKIYHLMISRDSELCL